jgi:hypothetical protein
MSAEANKARGQGNQPVTRTGRRAIALYGSISLAALVVVASAIWLWQLGGSTSPRATPSTLAALPTLVPPLPSPGSTTIGAIQFIESRSGCDATEEAPKIPPGRFPITAHFDASGFRSKLTELQWVLRHNGRPAASGTGRVNEQGAFCLPLESAAAPLPAGYYELLLQREDTSVRSDFFSVGVPPARPRTDLVFATQVTADGTAVDPGTTFPAAITTLYAAFPLAGLPPGMQPEALDPAPTEHYVYLKVKGVPVGSIFGWRWYREGRLLNAFDNDPIAATSSYYWLQRWWERGGIQPGTYDVLVVLNGAPVQRGHFVIRP